MPSMLQPPTRFPIRDMTTTTTTSTTTATGDKHTTPASNIITGDPDSGYSSLTPAANTLKRPFQNDDDANLYALPPHRTKRAANIDDGYDGYDIDMDDISGESAGKDPSGIYSAHRFQYESEGEGELLNDGYIDEEGEEVELLKSDNEEDDLQDPVAVGVYRPPTPGPVLDLDFQSKNCGLFDIVAPPLVNPRSFYKNYQAPLKKQLEVNVLKDFKEHDTEPPGDDGIYYRIEQFVAYRPQYSLTSKKAVPNRLGLQMAGFHIPNVTRGESGLCANGILVSGDGKRKAYVEDMIIHTVSVDYSGPDIKPTTWVQSSLCKNSARPNKDIWYIVGDPAPEYARYHEMFVWLTAFGRYFIGFLEDEISRQREEIKQIKEAMEGEEIALEKKVPDVTLVDFREKFVSWLEQEYGGREDHHGDGEGYYFIQWLAQYQEKRVRARRDFRSAVIAHRDWLWNQTFTTSHKGDRIQALTLWSEINCEIIKKVPGTYISDTIVTAYVNKCFSTLFPKLLKTVFPPCPDGNSETIAKLKHPSIAVEIFATPQKDAFTKLRVKRKSSSSVAAAKGWNRQSKDRWEYHLPENFYYADPKIGDVVAFPADDDSKWSSRADLWLGYVTEITSAPTQENPDRTKLSFIWIYSPNDTVLNNGTYPYKNERFFSQHCTHNDLAEGKGKPLYNEEVVEVVNVKWFADPSKESASVIIRQIYTAKEHGFVTLKQADLQRCACEEFESWPFAEASLKYEIGDTILVEMSGEDFLQPVVVHNFDNDAQVIHVRVLKRRAVDEPGCKINEVLFTHYFLTVQPAQIHKRCRVRVVPPARGGDIPAPYDRNGAGDCFFLSYEEDDDGNLQEVTALSPEKLRQGYLPADPPPAPRLNGLDLFCGGGNFGRGLEEGGAVKMKYAVDIESAPLHSYRANLNDPSDTALYLGSINNFLRDAIQQKYSNVVPAPDQVDFISAGSPCQGFSLANTQRNNDRSIGNCSLVSSFATAIDIYRPKYALLENVHQIAQNRNVGEETGNVYSTLLCAVVGMGYQIQHFILDSWSYGNCQSRTRLFLAVTAPGEELLTCPARSHAHPEDVKNLSLYQAPNGETFGQRELDGLVTFPYRTSIDDMAYLPKIYDANVLACIPFPDHRVARHEADYSRQILRHVPRWPEKLAWTDALKMGYLDFSLRHYGAKRLQASTCRAWGRIQGNGLCRTITTSLTPACKHTGNYTHYEEPRLITVQEARIAQGFPDDEVLVGSSAQQFKIVGNSVARAVSLGMGLALRSAHFGRAAWA